ncbi:13201_t:CDS:1 [Entrophospora sp. SA101]|nr:13201_t:CDS:1 [Entrophospora sp. SA101]
MLVANSYYGLPSINVGGDVIFWTKDIDASAQLNTNDISGSDQSNADGSAQPDIDRSIQSDKEIQFLEEASLRNSNTSLFYLSINRMLKKANEIVNKILSDGKLAKNYEAHYIYTHFLSYKRAIFYFSEFDDGEPIKNYWKGFKNQIIYEAQKPHRRDTILNYIIRWRKNGPECDNPLRDPDVNISDILQKCQSFKDPPLYNNNPYTVYSDNFIKAFLLPKLIQEAKGGTSILDLSESEYNSSEQGYDSDSVELDIKDSDSFEPYVFLLGSSGSNSPGSPQGSDTLSDDW